MVLPAKRPIRIFGTGKGEADIKFNGAAAHVISSEEKWCITLPAMEYGGPYTLEFIADGKTERLENVFVGEVYLFAGQSNIAFMLSASNTPKEDYEELQERTDYAEKIRYVCQRFFDKIVVCVPKDMFAIIKDSFPDGKVIAVTNPCYEEECAKRGWVYLPRVGARVGKDNAERIREIVDSL